MAAYVIADTRVLDPEAYEGYKTKARAIAESYGGKYVVRGGDIRLVDDDLWSPTRLVVIEFPDGLHEYVTTPVKRVLKLCDRDIYYIQTANSRYRLEVRSNESSVASEAPAAK